MFKIFWPVLKKTEATFSVNHMSVLALLGASLLSTISYAQQWPSIIVPEELPAVVSGQTALISPELAWDTYYSGLGTTHTQSGGDLNVANSLNSSGIGAQLFKQHSELEIGRLAQALQNDPAKIFDFVRNRVELNPTFGMKGGGRQALYTLSGTAFDQADLLVRLLRKAGYTANFVLGKISLDAQQAADWLGVSYLISGQKTFNQTVLEQALADGGIPAVFNGSNVTLMHIWVEANVDGSTLALDPSLQENVYYEGDLNVSSANYLSAIALQQTCENNSICITTPNKTGLESQLGTSVDAFVASLKSSLVDANNISIAKSLIEVTGGFATIDEPVKSLIGYGSMHPFSIGTSYGTWAEVPDAFRVSVKVDWGDVTGLDGFADEILAPGVIIPIGEEGDQAYYTLELNMPYAAESGTYMNLKTHFSRGAPAIQVANGNPSEAFPSQSVQIGFEVGKSRPDQSQLNAPNILSRNPSYIWQRQHLLMARVQGDVGNTLVQHHYLVSSSPQIYTEQPNVFELLNANLIGKNKSMLDVRAGLSANHKEGISVKGAAVFDSIAATSAMLEGNVFAQSADFEPVLIESSGDLAALNAKKAGKFYYVSNQSQFSALTSSLSTYDGPALSWISSYIDAGYHVVLPQLGNLGNDLNYYNLVTAFAKHPSTGAVSDIVYRSSLSTGFKGGGAPSAQNPEKDIESQKLSVDPFGYDYRGLPEEVSISESSIDTSYSPQPDLTVGSGDYPYSLSLRRTYSSSELGGAKGFGTGWTSNIDRRATLAGDGVMGLGFRNPLEGAAALVVFKTIQDIFSDASKTILEKSYAARVATGWLSQHFRRNTITFKDGSGGQSYMLEGYYKNSQSRYLAPAPDSSFVTRSGVPEAKKIAFDAYYEGDAFDYEGSVIRRYFSSGSYITYGNLEARRQYNLLEPTLNGEYGPSPDVSRTFFAESEHFPSGVIVNTDWREGKLDVVLDKIFNNIGPQDAKRFIQLNATKPYFTSQGGVIPEYWYFISASDDVGRTARYEAGPNIEALTNPAKSTLASFDGVDGKKWLYKYDFGLTIPTHLTTVEAPHAPDKPLYSLHHFKRRDSVWALPIEQSTASGSVANSKGAKTLFYNNVLYSHIELPKDLAGDSPIYWKRWDAQGRVVEQTDALGETVTISYDSWGRVNKVVSPSGVKTEYQYDSNHNVVKKTITPKAGSSVGEVSSRASYSDMSYLLNDEQVTINKLDYIIDQEGKQTDFIYYPNGKIHKIKGPCIDGTSVCADSQRPITIYTYTDALDGAPGKIKTILNPENIITSYSYDAYGNLAMVVIDGQGKVLKTVHFYDKVGNLCRTVGPNASAGLTGGYIADCDLT